LTEKILYILYNQGLNLVDANVAVILALRFESFALFW